MDICLKTCMYEYNSGILEESHLDAGLNNLGFDCQLFNGPCLNLFEYMSKHKVDILVASDVGVSPDRFKCFLEIIYNNFCKNILVLSNDNIKLIDDVVCLNINDASNLDLKLSMSLLDLKRKIEDAPNRNLYKLRTKIYNLLYSFMFSSRHDGFKYYAEAVMRSYLQFPYEISIMDLYKEIAEKYNKSTCAVEKGMRTALMYAYNRLKGQPVTEENIKLKNILTYDMTNKKAIGMMVSWLTLNKDKEENEETNLVSNIYQ